MERLEYNDVLTSVHLTLVTSDKPEEAEGADAELAPGTTVG